MYFRARRELVHLYRDAQTVLAELLIATEPGACGCIMCFQLCRCSHHTCFLSPLVASLFPKERFHFRRTVFQIYYYFRSSFVGGESVFLWLIFLGNYEIRFFLYMTKLDSNCDDARRPERHILCVAVAS